MFTLICASSLKSFSEFQLIVYLPDLQLYYYYHPLLVPLLFDVRSS